jgi:hypothetical protein
MSEVVDITLIGRQVDPAVGAVFTAQRETAIALRSSTAETRIVKLRRLGTAVLENHDADLPRACRTRGRG